MSFESWTLEEASIALIDGDRGKNYPKQADFTANGHCLFLSAKNVTKTTGFQFDDFAFISIEKDEQLRAGKLQRGDIVVTTRGTIGNVALYSDDVEFEHIRINSGMLIVRVDPDVWDARLLYFVMRSQLVQQQIEALTSGSAVPQLPARDFKKFQLPKIPLATQKQIAEVAFSLTNKIALNTQTNQTLEQMAQALFKSWFVDFDPVIDNALAAGNPIPEPLAERARARQALFAQDGVLENVKEAPQSADNSAEQHQAATTAAPARLPAATLALFPDSFKEHPELGWIPAGWKAARLDHFLELAYGKALKKTDRIAGDVPVYGSGGIGGYHNESLIDGPGIIVGRKGTVGSLYWEDENFFPIDTVFYVKPLDGVPLGYCFELLKTLGLEHMNTDAAVPGLNRNNAYRLLAPKPTSEVKKQFSDILESLKGQQLALRNESASLAKLRDTLLPKLLSGELTLPETTAKRQAETA